MCAQVLPVSKLLPASGVRAQLIPLIRRDIPDWSNDGFICFTCLDKVRTQYVKELMEKDLGELDGLEKEVVESLARNDLVAGNINEEYAQQLSMADRISDRVAEFGGSWVFIFVFAAVLVAWILINSYLMLSRPFDPYPYILLNLFLSMLAAIQAPVIMMSQNRQEERDRLRSENDYQVNLKAEVEIRMISEKLDQLIHNDWQGMLEIQQIQMEMIEDLHRKLLH